MLATSKEALDAFATSNGLGKLTFGSDRICSVEFDKSLVIEIEDIPETASVRLNVPLRPVADADLSVLHYLLAANFNGMGTGKAALSINEASGEIVLTQAIDFRRYTAADFGAEVQTFLRYALFWEQHAETLRPTVSEAPVPTAEGLINIRL